MTNEEILAGIEKLFPGAVVEVLQSLDFTIVLKADRLLEVATYLRDEIGLDYLISVTGVDRGDEFEVIYHLGTMNDRAGYLVLKVHVPRQSAEVPSVTPLWRGAEFQEDEVYDLMGIRFTGHPDLRRIMMWEGYEGHPLRKDFRPAYPIETEELVASSYAESENP
ncbi:MAG: NADH-quinone oxidoreductase subunit C [Anaerolineae bacterium]|jgi:NADH/F420H2 dehydrogenase subunit C|nr:NADH-quinone oxidoreductase subunit C [Anaerolineae bacterium]MDH7475039.1 NADH-quinone oxidoreductase subunit C [Anaerolineae bacterium]